MKDIIRLFENPEEKKVNIVGWIRTNRDSGKLGFMAVNDGTSFNSVQIVYKAEVCSNFEQAKGFKTGAAVNVKGDLVLTPNSKQPFEIQASHIELLADCDDSFPLQKKRHTPEFLREIAHLRIRGNTYNAVMRMRGKIALMIHDYFNKNNFLYINSPIITGNDGEGAGESFVVTTRTDGNYDKDFYGKKATLGVTGQLHAEAFAQGLKKVYTFAPTFRAENSNTRRHASEFWMIEPEVAFNHLEDNMDLMEDLIKYVSRRVLKECPVEMDFFNKWIKTGVIARLQHLVESTFIRISYSEVIMILEKAVANGHVFEENNIQWGMDLGSEHERFICEEHFNSPVMVFNYPKQIKAFYMKQNDDGHTVAAVDMLVPGVGELIGGSEREANYEKLYARCKEMHIPTEDLTWYLELRKYGYAASAGFGLGFERLIMYITGVDNIRDVLPFPRTSNKLMF